MWVTKIRCRKIIYELLFRKQLENSSSTEQRKGVAHTLRHLETCWTQAAAMTDTALAWDLQGRVTTLLRFRGLLKCVATECIYLYQADTVERYNLNGHAWGHGATLLTDRKRVDVDE